jgi:hypothetical protein
MNCPQCQSESVIKRGCDRLGDGTLLQRYQCKGCGKRFNERSGTFPPSESVGWTIHVIKRDSRYWLTAQAGHKDEHLLATGVKAAWQWAKGCDGIRWFTDGERRYGQHLWALASVYLKAGEVHPDYGHRQVWREGVEVAMKIKGSQGTRRVEWVKHELG